MHTSESTTTTGYRRQPLLLTGMGILLLLTPLAGCTSPEAEAPSIHVVSSPPEFVSGGDARLEITVPPGTALEEVTLERNGVPVDEALVADETHRVLDVVVQGLPEGESTFVARAGDRETSVRVVNYPRTGPMFSGPAQEPFFCATAAHRAHAQLGEVLDEACSLETTVSFVYLSTTTDDFEPFDSDAPRPADMAQATTTDGRTVDFIVRWERGTINRFIYSIAVLSPNASTDNAPDLAAWNRKLIYYFQGGVGIGHYQGDPSRSRMLYRHGLSKGYAIAYSTGTKTGTHYDLEVGGETALMVKDRFVTAYGKPDYTVGVGASGGGIQQYVYGQNHPGLLDAAIPQYAYPDMVTQTIHIGDCELLERYMDAEVATDPDATWATWSNRPWLEGLNASDTLPNRYNGGQPGLTECINGWRGLSPLSLNPHYGTAPGITPEQQAAVEWTHYADVVQIYGRAADGFAARTWDNVGVQYGLNALLDGHLSPEAFLDLNARVGSWKNEPDMVQEGEPFIEGNGPFDPYSRRNMNLSPDDRGDVPAPRAAADSGAIEAAYERGLVFAGKLDIPTIDWRHYLERQLDMHNTHQSFAARQRMLNQDGDASNQVIWFTDVEDAAPRFDQTPMAFEVIDEWMANMKAHPERSVAANKPERAVDSCFGPDGSLHYAGDDAWAGILDDRADGPCTAQFPIYGTSRIAAGAPITGDIFKCRLQPVAEAVASGVYGRWTPSPEQEARLRMIFPQGVCDYMRGDRGKPR